MGAYFAYWAFSLLHFNPLLSVALSIPAGSGFDARAHDAIRPPGALWEEAFLARCITCGACSASCPTGVIVSDVGKTGIEGLFTPVFAMRRGWCEPSCIRCMEVCPTGALELLTPKAKQAIGAPAEFKIGTAFDHEATGFALDGQHQRVACTKCHLTTTLRDGSSSVRYRLGYRQCKDCHANPHREGP